MWKLAWGLERLGAGVFHTHVHKVTILESVRNCQPVAAGYPCTVCTITTVEVCHLCRWRVKQWYVVRVLKLC